MTEAVKRVLRSFQTNFPFVHPVRFAVHNYMIRRFGWHIDDEFRPLARLRPIGLALDIGANRGQSIAALKRVAAPGRIISFEPNGHLAEGLARRFAKDATVTIEHCALADQEGRLDLYIPRYGRYVFDGLSSLIYEEAANWLDDQRLAWFDPAKVSVERQIVPIRTLDAMGLSPDVVKIDVQGAEHQVVLGGIETFRRAQPISIVEAPTEELIDLFATLGMAAYGCDGERLNDQVQNAKNVLFLSDERRRSLGL